MFNPKPRGNKKLLILLLPIIACVFIIGWIMYWTGDNAKAAKPHKASVHVQSTESTQ